MGSLHKSSGFNTCCCFQMEKVMLRVHSADLHDHVAQEIGECLETGKQRLRPEQSGFPCVVLVEASSDLPIFNDLLYVSEMTNFTKNQTITVVHSGLLCKIIHSFTAVICIVLQITVQITVILCNLHCIALSLSYHVDHFCNEVKQEWS